jgi:HAD superfamily hydrolase (TIGR01509 family)
MREADVRTLLSRAGVNSFFEALVTSADVGRPKPDPAILLVALARLGDINPARACYVGDRVTDEEAAVAAGMGYAPVTEAGLCDALSQWLGTQR